MGKIGNNQIRISVVYNRKILKASKNIALHETRQVQYSVYPSALPLQILYILVSLLREWVKFMSGREQQVL